ncbi:MAG: hypothetical protein HFG28_03255 [Eubacterium sp.]|nr:hypothetical protein [Eubacterium sp.]
MKLGIGIAIVLLYTYIDLLVEEYALGELSSNIFIFKFTYYISEKKQLIAEVVNQWNEER